MGKDAEPITESLIFDENKQFTVEYTDLTPLTEYTFTVIVLTDDDIPSLPASVSFKQSKHLYSVLEPILMVMISALVVVVSTAV